MGNQHTTVGVTGQLLLVTSLLLISAVGANEETLLKAIRGHSPEIRPKLNASEPVVVTVELDLYMFVELDEVTEILDTNLFFYCKWKDEFLTWDPADHDGLEKVVLKPSSLWLPDFGISNSVTTFYRGPFYNYFRATVHHTGLVQWSFGGLFDTRCDIDMTYFPFDHQECEIQLSNWAYTTSEVDLDVGGGVILRDHYEDDGIWTLTDTSVSKEELAYRAYPNTTFPMIIFKLKLSRKPAYYLINILLPCVFMILIALVEFWLPPEAGEKVSLAVTVVLAFSCFQLVIADSTPENSDNTSMLTIFVTFMMGVATLSTIATVFVLYLHHKQTAKPVPRWIGYIAFNVIARVLCLSVPRQEDDSSDSSSAPSEVLVNPPEYPGDNVKEKSGETKVDGPRQEGSQPLDAGLRLAGKQVSDVMDQLELLRLRTQNQRINGGMDARWRNMESALDRCLCVIVLVYDLLNELQVPGIGSASPRLGRRSPRLRRPPERGAESPSSPQSPGGKETGSDTTATNDETHNRFVGNQISAVLRELRWLTRTMRDKQQQENLMEEWMMLAVVVDRCLFIIVLALLTGATLWFFITAKIN